MGLFDGVKVVAGIIKGGIAMANACEKMDKLIKQSITEYKPSLTTRETSLYDKYNEVRLKKLDAETGSDEASDIEYELEAAQVAYLMALKGNGGLPQAFREDVKAVLKEYEDASGMAMNGFKDILMKNAKTPEEKAEVERVFAETT